MTINRLPEDELAANLAAGQHPALNTPVARLMVHPTRTQGLLMPLGPSRAHQFGGAATPPAANHQRHAQAADPAIQAMRHLTAACLSDPPPKRPGVAEVAQALESLRLGRF